MESHVRKYRAELLKTLHDCHVRVSKQWGNQKGDWICKECGDEKFAFEKRCDECHADNVEFTEMGLAS
jgi:RNase P subunit RPR2